MNTKTLARRITQTACASDKVGDVQLLGIYGGAVCHYWRVVEIVDGTCTLDRVEPVSVCSADGTYSTRYEVV
jgi:hypothetical protein